MKTKKLLLKFRPLEPYFFGDENSIHFNNSNRYFVSSLPEPSAMTVLGTLRYAVLEQNGLLHADGRYSPEEQQINARYIGENSFRLEQTDPYGMVCSLSPLFLVGPCNELYIKLPLNHRFAGTSDRYIPMALGAPVQTSYGLLRLPAPEELSLKVSLENQYMCVETGLIRDDLFSDFMKVTNNLGKPTDNFLKKNLKLLKPGFSFGVIAELEEGCHLESTLCHMGREKCGFSLTVEEGFCLEDRLQNGYLGRVAKGFSYALGDLVLKVPASYTAFATVQTKNLRYLSTQADSSRIHQSQVLHSVIRAGSVFYCREDLHLYGSDRFGINRIITFGGNDT